MSQLFVWVIDENLQTASQFISDLKNNDINHEFITSHQAIDTERGQCTFILCHIKMYDIFEEQFKIIHTSLPPQCAATYVYGEIHHKTEIENALLNYADDFIILPSYSELLRAKLKANMRMFQKMKTHISYHAQVIKLDQMTIDPLMKRVTLNDVQVPLTLTEFNIIYTLANNPMKTFSMDYLFTLITGQNSFGDYNAIMTHISRMRKKIAQIDATGKYIITVRNQGYRFNEKLFKSNDKREG